MRSLCYINRDFASSFDCDEIMRSASATPAVEATTFNASQDHRKSQIKWIDLGDRIKSNIEAVANEANHKCFGFDVDYTMREQQFTQYFGQDNGKYDLHHDVDLNSGAMYDRKLSLVIQLSDPSEYEGGRLYFPEVVGFDPEKCVQRGSLIIFPSFLQHAVLPVTQGVRTSFVTWFWGPKWK